MAKTDNRLFAPFPIEMDEHPKIAPLSDAAFRALFEGTFYSRRMLSDGFLDERIVLKRWGQAVADELATNDRERPSWVPVEGGWMIHDFGKHHPLRADIEERRAAVSVKRAEAGKRGNESRWAGNDVASESQTDRKPIANDRSETETETETEKIKRVSATRGTRLPADWMPSEALTEWARGERADLDIGRQVAAFKDYWPAQAGARGVKVSWDLTFRSWIRNARSGPPSRPAKDVRALTLIEQGRAMDEAVLRRELTA